MKTCNRCKTAQHESEFHVDRSKPDGLRSSCKACIKRYNSAFYVTHTDEIKQRARSYHAAHREAIRAHRAACAAQISLQYRRWYARNAEHKRAYCREYGRTHPRVLR